MNLKAGARALLVLAALAVIATGIKLSAKVLAPLVVAWCLASLAAPAVRWLSRRRVPVFAAVGLTMFGATLVLLGFATVLAVAAQDIARSLPRLEHRLVALKADLIGWLEAHHVSNAGRLFTHLEPTRLDSGTVQAALTQTHELLVACSVVFFVALFMLLELPTLRVKLGRSLGWRAHRFAALRRAMGEMQRYLVIKTWISLAMGVCTGLLCWALGIEYPVLWGLVTYLLNYIPVIGGTVATIAPTALALIDGGVGQAALALGGLLLVHNVLGNIVEPTVLGRAVQLSPLVVMLSLLIWGWLLGPVGALLSVPLTTTVKFLLNSTDDLRWVAVILGPDEAADDTRGYPPGGARPAEIGAA